MRKMFLLLFVFLPCVALRANDRLSYSLETVGGVGLGKGPLFTITQEFVTQYEMSNGFIIGGGTGFRFAMPCEQYITRNGSSYRSFCNEISIPVFLRFGYGFGKAFMNLDAGYAIGLLSFYGAGIDSVIYDPYVDDIQKNKKEFAYNGIVSEPQVGWNLSRRSALAIGVLLQRSTLTNQVTTGTGTYDSPDFSTKTDAVHQKVFTPAITLRYRFTF